MGKLMNEITIHAPLEKIWDILTNVSLLDQYDPTVKKSTLISSNTSGLEAKRKVDMMDGKNWFEEKISVFIPYQSLAYQLTACSFPISGLKHNYSFEREGNNTTVKQVMEYSVKFGILGRLLDSIMIRKQFHGGIRKFLAGLKFYAEATS